MALAPSSSPPPSTTSRKPPRRCGTCSPSSCPSSPSPSPRSFGSWSVGRCVRSRRSAAEVEGIGGEGLDRRVPVPPGDDEVARLARTMNGMLERIEAAADRQRRFVADAAHELRTPLTRMRTELEVDLAHPAGADPAATAASVLAEVEGLQRLVDDLLDLARTDAGASIDRGPSRSTGWWPRWSRPRPGAEPVDRDDARSGHGGRRRRARCAARRPTSLDNAVRHAGRVDVTLRAEGEVRRAGGHRRRPRHPAGGRRAGVRALHPPRHGAHPRRRRHRPRPGIARAVAEAHGGTVAVDLDHVGGARLVARLPI